ncbi:MAG: amidohydrolase family protein [Anaerolineae bacterium]|jgi:aminocarboxymuconate-semialdehyde decarboxylase
MSAGRSLACTDGIDIHHHFLPPFFGEALDRGGHPAASQAGALGWTPRGALDRMDAAGIEAALLALSLPGVSFRGAADPAALARQSNEYAARLIADHPGRFGAFASLPLLDRQAALAEVEYALDTLNLDGVLLLSNVRDRYLGDAAFDPVLAELDRRRAIVFLHPNHAPGPGFNRFVEFPHDVTRALASLTESEAIERYPHIRYILAYGGGTLPFIAARVTVVGMDVFGSFLKTMIHYLKRARTMRRMRYDLTATTDPYAWRALVGHTQPDRILMGSNYPWASAAAFARQQADWRACAQLDPAQMRSIERNNALQLFPRFA